MAPRAFGSQWGAPRPANAGTRKTPPVSGTLAASRSTSAEEEKKPSPSRSHCTTAPAMNTLPSSAYSLRARLRAGGGDQAVCRLHRLVAGVQQHEAAGAVGVLRHAGRVAGLAEQRRLLVAGDAGDEERLAEDARGHHAEGVRRGMHLGQDRARHVAAAAAARRPTRSVWMLKSSVREALDDVGDVRAVAGELPDEPGIDGAERELAALRALARAGNVVEQPRELGAAEIGVDHQPGALADQALARRPRAAPRTARRCAGPARRWRCAIGSPVCRSQTMVVSRWLVMPIAITSLSRNVAPCAALRARRRAAWRRSRVGSCSTQPGCGKIWRNSRCAERHRCRRPRRRGSRASWWCPDRGRGRTSPKKF